MKNRILASLLIIAMLLVMLPITVSADSANVAKVGSIEYATIDEAIAAWTNNTTLTLLADVTLSDVVTLKSTEHHTLNLDTYTMTAADGKNAFVIKACGTGDSERSAITINADAVNPGGINAGTKCVVYYKYADGGISTNDRPIIKINGGVFTGSTSSWGTAGIYTIGTEARKCATLNIAGGTFNCSINGSYKSKMIISGGTFNYSVGSQGDSTASRLISGGKFKTFGFMTADSNNTKFWIGTSMGNSNVGVYVDDDGYIVVGGPVITEPGTAFKASSANYSGASSYLQYSSAKDNGLYYTSYKEAFADNNKATGSVTVYVDEINMTGISYKGTILLPEAISELTVTFAEGTTPAWKVSKEGKNIVYTEKTSDGVVTRTYFEGYTLTYTDGIEDECIFEDESYPLAIDDEVPVPVYDGNPTRTGYTFAGWDKEIPATIEEDVTITAQWTANSDTPYTVKHHFAKLDEGYDIETETEYGTTGVETAAEAKSVEGFTAGEVTQSTIAGDGSTVVNIYYDRIVYTQTFKFENGEDEKTNTVKYGAQVSAPAAPTKIGYTFAGWYYTDEAGSSQIWDFETDTVTSDVTLTAQWTAVGYTISYNLDGGTVGGSNPTSYKVTSDDITLINPTKTGYAFAGWTGTDLDAATKEVTIQTGSTGNREYTATWTAVDYTISYTLDGGTVDGKNPTGYNVTSENITLINPTKTGYAFAGWTGTDLDAATEVVTISKGSTGNREYTATWTAVDYAISYNLDDGTVDGYNPTSYKVTSDDITLINPTKTGYSFAGWTGTGLDAATEKVIISKGSTGDREYTATWTAKGDTPYTVKHWQQNINGGNDENETNYTLANTDELTGTTAAEITPPVKNYEGFTAPAAKSVTIAADGNTVVNYYYTRNSYTVTYKVNGEVYEEKHFKYGEEVTVPEYEAEEGYTFSGWYTPDTMPAEDIEINASYGNVYTITWSNGDDGGYVKNYTYGETITLPESEYFDETMRKPDYFITGWVNEEGYEVGDSMPAMNLTFTAQYTKDLSEEIFTTVMLLQLSGDNSVTMMPEKDVLGIGDALDLYQMQTMAPAARFVDVAASDWFHDSVISLANKGVVSGYPDGSFRPQGEVTWGEALKLVMKAVGYGDIDPTNGHWASGFMAMAIEKGLIPGEVELDAAITRGEMADLTALALKLGEAKNAAPFADEAPASAAALYEAGIINGSMDNGQLLYRAESTITRAEMAAIIWRVYCAR